jgi:hypothetical protein
LDSASLAESSTASPYCTNRSERLWTSDFATRPRQPFSRGGQGWELPGALAQDRAAALAQVLVLRLGQLRAGALGAARGLFFQAVADKVLGGLQTAARALDGMPAREPIP